MIDIIDRRAEAAGETHNLRGIQILTTRGSTHRSRSRINSIVLHQMGFTRGSAEDAFDRVIAHFCVLQSGMIVQLRDYEAVLNDADGGHAIELEFEGDLVPHGATIPSAVQLSAGRKIVTRIVRELGTIRGIYAHVQFNPHGRPYCCGPHIWQNIGDWAGRTFGLRTAPPHARGEIPTDWADASYQVIS